MIDKVQKIKDWISKELVDLMDAQGNFEYPEHEGAFLILCNLDAYIDSLQEKPVSGDLEEAANAYAVTVYNNYLDNPKAFENIDADTLNEDAFKAGAQWQKEHLWKPANGRELPEIDRDVICLLDCDKVVKAHRPSKKDNLCVPETYGKGGWSYPNIKYWLDIINYE